MSATGNEFVKLNQLKGSLDNIKEQINSTNLTDTNNSITRTTGGSLAIKDGQELVNQVQGQSYCWNQLFNYADITASYTSRGITFTNNNDGSITCNGTASGGVAYMNIVATNKLIVGHKYLMQGGSSNVLLWFNGTPQEINPEAIFTITSGGGIYLRINDTTTLNNVKVYPQLFDLTAMGLDNITTVAQFKALFPNTYYPYSAPTLVSANNEYKNIGRNLVGEYEQGWIDNTGTLISSTTNIRSKNFTKLVSGQTYFIKTSFNSDHFRVCYYDSNKTFISRNTNPVATFTMPTNATYIKLTGSNTYGGTYNHDIIVGIGSTPIPYEPYQSNLLSYNGTLERKVGRVKLKDLTYGYASDNQIFYSTTSPSGIKNQSLNVNILSNKYTTYSGTYWTAIGNGQILIQNGIVSGSVYSIIIKDTTYTDATVFKNHFTDDDVLYYELATPTTEEIVNATNVELKGVGTAKDTLYNESGLASWKNGLTEQVNKNGIVAIPYSVSEEFAVSINGQLQHNLDVDKSQQEEIRELTSRMYFTETSTNNPAQLYGGNWTQVGTTTIGTTTIYCWKKGE